MCSFVFVRVCVALHADLIPLRAAYEDDRSLYLIMELAKHGDMAAFMAKRTIPIRSQASVLQQVLSGLNVMHKMSIIHRDVKLRNVMSALPVLHLCRSR